MVLPNLGSHARAVDMGTTLQREIRSNERDYLLDGSANGAVDVSVASGGTIALTTEERLTNSFVNFTGSPATEPLLELPETARQIAFLNSSTKDIVSTLGDGELLLETTDSLLLEDGSGVLLLEASSVLVPATETRLFQKDGTAYRTIGRVGLQDGALLHSGQVAVTGAIDFVDFAVSRITFKDYGFTTTSPSSGAGTLVLDMENGNYFDITLTENISTLTLSNPPASGKAGTIVLIATQDGGGGNTITWPGSVIWERVTGRSPDQTTTSNAVDIYMFLTVDAGTTWYGFVLGLDMK